MITNLENTELAGCLDIVNDKVNSSAVITRLTQLLALCYDLPKSEEILTQIKAETEECFVPCHEYVINELQYEYRFASALKYNERYENELLSKWTKTIVLRYNVGVADLFLGLVKANRETRKR